MAEIPAIIETLSSEPLKAIAAQGFGYLLFITAAAVAGWLVLELRRSNKDHAEEIAKLYEARLTEAKTILTVVESQTKALNMLSVTMDARTVSINALVSGFADLAKDIERGRSLWEMRIEAFSRELVEVRRCAEAMQYGRKSA